MSNTLANENLCVKSDYDTETKFEIPVEIINNYLLKYFSDRKVFLSFFMQASDDIEHEKQTKIIDKLYTESIYTHFSHININHEVSSMFSNQGNQRPFLLIFVDGVSSFA